MPTSPRGADELVAAQAIPETTVNEIIRHTEAGACLFPVVDQDLTAPPGACADGANYIIAASPTGAWSGKAKQIATALGTNAANGWRYHVPVEGFFAFVQDEDLLFKYDGADWVEFAGGGGSGIQVPEAINCFGEPDYPEAVAGDSYLVSAAGKIGGATGVVVDDGDWIICWVDNAGGSHASVGSSWFIIEHNFPWGDASTRTYSIETDLGGIDADDVHLPTQLAVKTYVDDAIAVAVDPEVIFDALDPGIFIKKDDGSIDTRHTVLGAQFMSAILDGSDIVYDLNPLGTVLDNDVNFGTTEGTLPIRGPTIWEGLPPPAIDATTYILSITDGVHAYIDVDSVGSSYTNENAQDAVGGMVDTTLVYTDATPLLSRAALTGAITAAEGSNTTALGSFTKSQLDTAVSDGNVLYVGDAYVPGGTDVALADGGTGASLADPNADRIMFWDDSAGQITWLAPDSSLTISGTTLSVNAGSLAPTEHIICACSDETSAITTGTAKRTFRMPYAFTVTEVRASVTTAPTGSTIIIDINESGSSILGTKLSIDASEKTSTTAASAATITDASLADDAEITIDFDQVGSTVSGSGVKVYIIGHR